MADIENALVKKLNTVPEISGKIHPINGKKGEPLPYVIYQVTADNEADSLGSWVGNYEVSIEINIICKTYESMKPLSIKVKNALKTMNNASVEGIYIQAVEIESNQPEIYEAAINAYRKIIELKVSY